MRSSATRHNVGLSVVRSAHDLTIVWKLAASLYVGTTKSSKRSGFTVTSACGNRRSVAMLHAFLLNASRAQHSRAWALSRSERLLAG